MRGVNISKTDEERPLHPALLVYKCKHLKLSMMKTLDIKQPSKSMVDGTILSQETRDNRLETLDRQSPSSSSESGRQAGFERAESLMRLTASFLGALARQENSILEAEQQSIGTMEGAQKDLARKKEETMEALKTLW